MQWTKVIVGVATLGLVSSACSKGAQQDGTVRLELEGLPDLEARVPSGTTMSKNAVGIGVMLKGPGVSMTIGPALEVDAASLEDAKHNAQSYAPEDVEGQTLSDGYILTYESTGSTGTNYWLVGRRTFADAAYTCGVSSPKKEHQQSAIAICKSLSK